MNLSFKTHIDKKPTLFTNKIAKSMWENYINQMTEFSIQINLPDYYIFEDLSLYDLDTLIPKIHTIRADPRGRWKNGNIIDFFVYPRNKKMFRFAPRIPAVLVQKIEIEYYEGQPIVVINWKHFYNPIVGIDHGIEELAQNDGFNSSKEFFEWFNQDFSGVIIHWTEKTY